jgi:hypothetical protein
MLIGLNVRLADRGSVALAGVRCIVAIGIRRLLGRAALLSGVVGPGTGVIVLGSG